MGAERGRQPSRHSFRRVEDAGQRYWSSCDPSILMYDVEIVKVLKDRFLIHDFAQIMTVYGSVEFVPEEGAELSTDDMALQFVGKTCDQGHLSTCLPVYL
jgi:hypothetical protein